MTGQYGFEESDVKLVSGNGKRASSRGGGVGVDTPWRCPKRQRDSGWRGVAREESTVFLNSKLLALQSSLRDVCSFDDLKERMKVYLSLGSCKEIFNVMTQVTKNIDEGRLKMKSHCPIVTDVGLKEKASRILMCYNPIWLRIGLYIIFGGDSLLSDEDINSEKEIAFLKMVIEKQAKSQSCLPIKYGIDGLDGGSPLLFTLQPNIKSSCQVIHDFLSSDVMHGEGNVLAHLVIVGYKVSYLQSPFNEYDFRVKELFEDLQDGVRLCRAIQLLQHDASILMKMLVPSDTRKKNVVNCGVALQQLKQAGVPLFDEDGSMIVAEDIVSGDKELTLSLLWNIFLPLLINKTPILEEISRIQGVNAEHLNNSTLLDMLLNWIQAICESYNFKVDNFASPVDGKAMWCLLDYYFRKELNCSCSLKDVRETSGETSIMSVSDYTDAVHSFILSQKLTTLLGNFPEVLQVSDILEHNGPCNSQSVIILLVFLSFQLLVRKNTEQLNFHKLLGFTCQSPERRRLSMDQCFAHSEAILNQEDRHVYNTEDGMRNFKAIMAWRQDMAMRNKRFNLRPGTPPLQFLSTRRSNSTMQREVSKPAADDPNLKTWRSENSLVIAWLIYSMEPAIGKPHLFLPTAKDVWEAVRDMYSDLENSSQIFDLKSKLWRSRQGDREVTTYYNQMVTLWQELDLCYDDEWDCPNDKKRKQSGVLGRYITNMVDRHNFVKLKRSATIIEHATRAWISRRHHESHCRGWLIRKEIVVQKEAVIKIQSAFRCIQWQKLFDCYRHAAPEIQRFVRGQIARRRLLGASFLPKTDPTGCILTSTDYFQNLELGLLVTLSDILSMKSVSGILHTCATLDMATKHSQKCCEKLVEAGAVVTLLKLIRSVSRSIPDQEVLKHALSTLRNLARYSHLTEVLVRSCGSVETILWELLRNKEEGYFIASELLRKICLNTKGVEAARSSPTLLKRLHNLVEDLTRKTGNEKSNKREIAKSKALRGASHVGCTCQMHTWRVAMETLRMTLLCSAPLGGLSTQRYRIGSQLKDTELERHLIPKRWQVCGMGSKHDSHGREHLPECVLGMSDRIETLAMIHYFVTSNGSYPALKIRSCKDLMLVSNQ
ncbi:unnamed protein product [Camellia sinensis]